MRFFRLPLAAAGLLLAAGAQAQGLGDEEQQQRLPEIVVTAQKIEQTLEEVPASVSMLDADTIRQSGANNFEAMQYYTPNVSIALNQTAGTIAVRGFATPDTNPGFDPSVGIVIDGVNYGRSQFITGFFFDLDRFEVLRGPQGTLFGKNSTAGVLNLVTRAPGREFEAGSEFVMTGYGRRTLRPSLQLPMGEQVSLRLSGEYSRGDDGVLHNSFLGRAENNPESSASRLRLRYEPGELSSLDLEAFISQETFNNNAFQFSALTPAMRTTLETYDPQIESIIDGQNSANYPSASDGRLYGGNATFNYDISGDAAGDLTLTAILGTATSVTARKELDADFSPVDFIHNVQAEPLSYQQISQELRLSGQGDNIFGFGHRYNFVFGAYLASSKFRNNSIFAVENLGAAAAYCNATEGFCGLGLPFALPAGVGASAGQLLSDPLAIVTALAGLDEQSAFVSLAQRSRSYAVFGQFEHFFLPQWALIGGLRFGNETKNALASSASDSQLIKAITTQENHDTRRSIRERDLSPKAGLKWEPNKRFSVYATGSRGYKSGGFNAMPLSAENLSYEPEVATSVEAGAKAVLEFLGGPMRVSASVFRTRFDNLQVSTFIGGTFVVLNAASAESQGFDFDLHWLTPLQGLSITASTGLADAQYRSYPCAPAITDSDALNTNAECFNDDMSQAQRDDIAQNTQDLGGQRLSFAPRWTASLVPAYQLPLQRVSARIALDVLYRGDRYLDVDLDPKKLQAETTIFNTRVSVESPGRNWALTLVAHNLTDEVFVNQAISQPLAPGNVLVYRTDYGRYISGNLTLSF